jgi:p38 MAP kinase
LNINSSADDSVLKQKVAIKKLSKPFETNIHAKRAYREIRLLKHVNHDNVIKLTDLFTRAEQPVDLDNM